MANWIARALFIVMMICGAGSKAASALEIQLLLRAGSNPATEAFINQLRTDGGLAAVNAKIEVQPPIAGSLQDVLRGKTLRLVVVSVDALIQEGLVKNSALVNSLSQPAQFSDSDQLFNTQDSAVGQAVLAQIGYEPSLVPIAFLSLGQTVILSKSPIQKVGDFKGKPIRQAFADRATSIAALGATSVFLPFAEVANALQQGLFDAAEFEASVATTMVALGTGVSSLSTNFRALIAVVVTGQEAWSALTEREKAAIARAVRAADAAARPAVSQTESKLREAANSRGFSVVNLAQSDAAGFQEASVLAFTRQFEAPSAQYLRAVSTTRDEIVRIRSAPPDPPQLAKATSAPIIFVTNRVDDGGEPQDRFQSGQLPKHQLTCGRVDYKPESGRRIGREHKAPFSISPVSLPVGESACVDFVAAAVKANGSRVLVYVHGFKNSFEDAVRRAISFSNDVGYEGVTLVWSWPAEKWAHLYVRDTSVAHGTRLFAEEFISVLLNRVEVKRLDVLAHSMGTQIALPIVAAFRKRTPPISLGTVILAAPDESAVNVAQVINEIVKYAPNLTRSRTIYAAAHDVALATSWFLHGRELRAGQGGSDILAMQGIDSVDATSADWNYSGVFTMGHSYVFDVPKVLLDISALIRDKSALDRKLNEHTAKNKIRYWTIPD